MGKEQETDTQYDSDDSVIHVPYVKPKPPEIVLTDSDGETSTPASRTSLEAGTCSNAGTTTTQKKKIPPSSTANTSQGTTHGKSKFKVPAKQKQKKKKLTSPKKKQKNKKKDLARKDPSVAQLFVPDALVYVHGDDSPDETGREQTSHGASATGQEDPATKPPKKKKKMAPTAVGPGVVDHPALKKPASPKKKKRARADSNFDLEQAAAIDHYNFLVSLNLAPVTDEEANPPMKKRAKKDKSTPKATIVNENTATSTSAKDYPTDPLVVHDVPKTGSNQINGFVAVQQESNKKGRKKSDVARAALSNKLPEKITGAAQTLPEKPVQGDHAKNNGTITLDELSADSIDETITMEELNSVQTNFRLNIGDGKRTLTLSQIKATQEKFQANRSRIFTPTVATTNRPASPRSSPAAKRNSPNSQESYFVTGPNKKAFKQSNLEKKRSKVKPDIDDLPWKEGEEGKIEDREFPTTWTPDMRSFYGKLLVHSINLEKVWRSQDGAARLWNVRSDLERLGMRSNQIRCNNCNTYGDHGARNCPQGKKENKCCMCGEANHNTKPLYNQSGKSKRPNGWRSAVTSCGKAMCLNCGCATRKAQKFMQMCQKCSRMMTTKCSQCAVSGHALDVCPDNWRRYHDVTTTDKLSPNSSASALKSVQYKPKNQQFCSNCATKGHSYYNCSSRRDLNTFYMPNNPKILAPPAPETLYPQSELNSRQNRREDKTSRSSAVQDKVSEKRPTRNEKLITASTSTSHKQQRGHVIGEVGPSSGVCQPKEGKRKLTESYKSASKKIMSSAIGSALVQKATKCLLNKQSCLDEKNSKDDDNTHGCRSNEMNDQCKTSAEPSYKLPSQNYKCKMIPDCKNYSSLYCFKISMSLKEHSIICELADEHNILDKLNSLYSENDVSISLLRRSPEFHVGGTQYYRARDRVFLLVHELRKNPYASMAALFPELYPPCETIGSSPEVIENDEIQEIIPDQLAQKRRPDETSSKSVTVITIDDGDDDIILEAPPSETVQTSLKAQESLKTLDETQNLLETVPIAIVKPTTPERSSVAGYAFEKRVRKILCQSSKSTPEPISTQKVPDSQPDKPSTLNTESQPVVSLSTTNTSTSTNATATSNSGSALADQIGQVNPKAVAPLKVSHSFGPKASSKEFSSGNRRTRFGDLFLPRDQDHVSSAKVSSENDSRRRSSSEGHARRNSSEILYDRRRRPSEHFESIKYGGSNPINFRDIPNPFEANNPISSNQVPCMPPNPSSNHWDGPRDTSNYSNHNPYFQEYNPYLHPPNWQPQNPWRPDSHNYNNRNATSSGNFQYDNYANMVIQNNDFHLPPPQYNNCNQNYSSNHYSEYDWRPNSFDRRSNDYSYSRGRSSGFHRRPEGNFRRGRGRAGPR